MLRFASFEPDMKQSCGFRENEASDVIDHVLLAKRIRYSFVYLIQASIWQALLTFKTFF